MYILYIIVHACHSELKREDPNKRVILLLLTQTVLVFSTFDIARPYARGRALK
jgi:hypothetical protein